MFKIVTGAPVHIVDKYTPQKYFSAGLHKEYATFKEMFFDLFMQGKPPHKKSLGFFVPGGLVEYAAPSSIRELNDGRGRRCNGNIGDLQFVAYDFDDMTPDECATILDALAESPYESAFYHTASSQPEKPKIRVLVALDGPTAATTVNKAPLMIDIAADIWGAPSRSQDEKRWYFLGVEFDRTAFRECQYMIRPHDPKHCVHGYFEGIPVNLDELPTVYDEELNWKLPGVYGDVDWSDMFDDSAVDDWLQWIIGRGLTVEGEHAVIVDCPNREQHSSCTDGTNSTVILLPKEGKEARFVCSHDHCTHLNSQQRETMIACGVPEALLVDKHGRNPVKVGPVRVLSASEKQMAAYLGIPAPTITTPIMAPFKHAESK